jgi:hypothetical protein
MTNNSVRLSAVGLSATIMALVILAALPPSVATASNHQANPRSTVDPRGDVVEIDSADFDIMAFGFSGNTPYIQVYGLAGRTIEIEDQLEDPEEHEGHAGEKVLAYVIDTNNGKWAIDFHSFDHDPDEPNERQWHGQHVDVQSPECVRVDSTESKAKMAGSRVFFEETSGVDTINGAQTMVLEIIVDPHEDPNAACHARLLHEFDNTNGIGPVSQVSKSRD